MDILSYELGKKAGGGGEEIKLQNKNVSISSNGTTLVLADSGYDGLNTVEVETNVQPTLQTKSVNISSNGSTTVSKDNQYDGMTEVNIITNVQPTNQVKSLTITENTTTTIIPDIGYDGLSSVEVTTDVSSGGTTEAPDNDVIFYDYDGTKLLSYTAEEFLALEEMPSLPANVNHPGLIPQGWNWTFSLAQDYVQENGALDVAQIYDADVALRVKVELDEAHLKPYLGITLSGDATVDWGDGTTPQTIQRDGSNIVYTQHIYQEPGNYTITVESENSVTIIGNSYYYQQLFVSGPNLTSGSANLGYGGCVKHIELGQRGFFESYAFHSLKNLETINMPQRNYATLAYASTFQNCYNLKFFAGPYIGRQENIVIQNNAFASCMKLKAISLPFELRSIATDSISTAYDLKRFIIPSTCVAASTSFGALGTCYNIKEVILPRVFKNASGQIVNANVSINSSMFSNCSALKHIFIPSKVNSIGSQAFRDCVSCQYIDFSEHTSVPTLSNANAFLRIFPDYKIIVPDNLYSSWTTANVWSSSDVVSHIISKSDWDALQNA